MRALTTFHKFEPCSYYALMVENLDLYDMTTVITLVAPNKMKQSGGKPQFFLISAWLGLN